MIALFCLAFLNRVRLKHFSLLLLDLLMYERVVELFCLFCSETRLLEIMENLCPDKSKKEVKSCNIQLCILGTSLNRYMAF